MKNSMNDKVVIVTGASSGIGLAMAKEFSARGAKVVLVARSVDKLREVASTLPTESLVVGCDVSSPEQCQDMVSQTIVRFHRIDVLINNAGLSMRALFDDVDLEVIHKLMNVNFWGTVYCTKYALPYLQKSKGSVVGISSVAGIHGLPARTGYSASKYAMQGFLETIRVENLRKGLHVMVVAPGFTESNVRFAALTADGTKQGESPRDEKGMMTAQQVAQLVAKGIEKRKREMVLDFQGKASKLIKKFAPALLDKIFYNAMAKEPDSPLK